jgi:acyl dehydratase
MALYLDDLHVGQRFTSGEYEMTAEKIKAFAAEFDPQPFHLDESSTASQPAAGIRRR